MSGVTVLGPLVSQYSVPVKVVDPTGTESYSKVLRYMYLSLFIVEKVRLHSSHRLLSSVPINACISMRVRRVVQLVRFSNAWGSAKVLLVVSVKSVRSNCMAVCLVVTVGESDIVNSGMSDSMSIPVSDMLSQLVVKKCLYLIRHRLSLTSNRVLKFIVLLESHSMRGAPVSVQY